MKKNTKSLLAIVVAFVVVGVSVPVYQSVTATHAVVQVSPVVDEASFYKGMFVLHGGQFSADDILVETSYPAGFAKLDVRGAYSSSVLFDGQRSLGIGHGYELILPKKIKFVSFVALSPEGELFVSEPLTIGSHADPFEERISTYDLKVNGITYFEVYVEAVGVVQKHHNSFSEFK